MLVYALGCVLTYACGDSVGAVRPKPYPTTRSFSKDSGIDPAMALIC